MAAGATGGSAGPGRRLAARVGLAAAGLVALAGLMAYLLVVHYRTVQTLRDDLLARRAQEARLHAAAVGKLLSVAERDVRNAAASAEVDAYFKNRDLGMSLRYGLALSLEPILARLRAMVEDRAEGEPPVLSRVVLLDEGGSVLADSGATGSAAGSAEMDEAATARDGLQLGGGGTSLLLSRPCQFKGRRVGRVVAWFSSNALQAALAEAGGSWLRLLARGGEPYRPAARRPSPLEALPALGAVPADGRPLELSAGADRLLAVRVPLAGGALDLLQVDPAPGLLAELSPARSVRGLLAAAACVLLAAGLAFASSARLQVLSARLQDSGRRKAELEAQHQALQREVSARERHRGGPRAPRPGGGPGRRGHRPHRRGRRPRVRQPRLPAHDRLGAGRGPRRRRPGRRGRRRRADAVPAHFATEGGWKGEVRVRRRDGARDPPGGRAPRRCAARPARR